MSKSQTVNITCTINEAQYSFELPPLTRLIDVLREDLQLTGTKEGCSEGECGACTVLINGELTNSCLVPIVQMDGASITTIEGLSQKGILNKIQQSFWERGGAQCGFCTPGMLMSTTSLINNLSTDEIPSEEYIREWLSGNLCRCTGYSKIIESVSLACEVNNG
ncbi:MAG: (2Fe-2S)-binding protein [Bacteriovoracaceae bacterium]|nr:(2Fe-2S)-binding protein [Bacteriovoracaceae bacterium]